MMFTPPAHQAAIIKLYELQPENRPTFVRCHKETFNVGGIGQGVSQQTVSLESDAQCHRFLIAAV